MLNPHHLVTLREVIAHGSFAAAANRLGYTPSAVSQQISALERDCGIPLFQRYARRAVPTEAALVMARHVPSVLAEIDRLVSAAERTHRSGGAALHLGMFPSFAMYILPQVLERGSLPGAALRLVIDDPSRLLPNLGSSGDLDAAIVYQVGQAGLSWPPSVSRRWITEDPFRLLYPSSWPERPGAPYPVERFVDLSWILNHPGTGDAGVIEGTLTRWDLHPRAVCYSDDSTATIALVREGVGVALMPEMAIGNDRAGVAVLDVPWLNLSRSIFALVGRERDVAGLPELIDALVAVAQRRAEDEARG